MHTTQPVPKDVCAALLIEVIPFVMRTMGAEMRQLEMPDISVPQFRALMIIRQCPGVSVSQVTEALGSTASATSKLIDGLIERQLVERNVDPQDRRRATLAVTPLGEDTVAAVHRRAIEYLLTRLDHVSQEDLDDIAAGLTALQRVFSSSHLGS